MVDPCIRCFFHFDDFGCDADPNEPWLFPVDCPLYDQEVVDDMIAFYISKSDSES